MLIWAIEAVKIAALAAMKPLFISLISSLLSPKFLLKTFMDLAEILAKHTATDFDDKRLEDLKELLKDDLSKDAPM